MYSLDEIAETNKKMHDLILKAMAKNDDKPLRILPLQEIESIKPNLYSTEYDECILLKDWLDMLIQRRQIKNYTHVPNETYTESMTQKKKNKDQGVRPGFPDYVILTNKCLIVIEMKRVKGGEVSDNQKVWLQHFTELGIPNTVANGFDEAKEFVNKYI